MATAEADIQNKIRKDKESSKEDSENYQEILNENVNAKSENIKAEQIKLSSEEDLESLLKLAEDLKEKVEKHKKNIVIFLLKFVQLISSLWIIYSIFLLYTLFTLYKGIPYPDKFVIPLGIILAVYFIFFAQFILKKERVKAVPDKLALKEVLQLLREVHGTIAEREDWSVLKRAEFRIRLSRFDLSEKKESVFNFFS